MTVDYLSRLSQGKPNQIRLLCSVIYDRFRNNQQTDLSISIEALDETLERVAVLQTEDVRARLEMVKNLNAVEFETLFGLTQFPNWSPGASSPSTGVVPRPLGFIPHPSAHPMYEVVRRPGMESYEGKVLEMEG